MGDGRITEWNAAAERLLGLTTGQLVGRTSIDPVWRLVSGALAVFRDVTAIESGGVGTALLDEQARVTFANAALAGILEVSREELLGCSLRRFVRRTDPVDALLDDMERGRGSLLAQDVCIATGHGEVDPPAHHLVGPGRRRTRCAVAGHGHHRVSSAGR